MEFEGTFTIDDAAAEEVWLALSNPVMIKHCLTGCKYLVEIDDTDSVDFKELAASDTDKESPMLPEADPEGVAARSFEAGSTYAAMVEIGVGSVKPKFKSLVTIEEREFPKMVASGKGSDQSNSFEMKSSMELSENEDDSVSVEWQANAEVYGRLAQMGQRVLNPVTNRVANKFFTQFENQLNGDNESTSLRGRIRDLV